MCFWYSVDMVLIYACSPYLVFLDQPMIRLKVSTDHVVMGTEGQLGLWKLTAWLAQKKPSSRSDSDKLLTWCF